MNRARQAVLVVMLGVLAFATGCTSAKPSAGQCTIITGAGPGESANIKAIGRPGEVKDKGDDRAWYFPCQGRNWVITNPQSDHGDSKVSVPAKTGGELKTLVVVQLSAYWQPNQNGDPKDRRSPMYEFWKNCLKFTCASEDPDERGTVNSSRPEWLNMLGETMDPAIRQAVREAMTGFDGSIWNDQAKWPELAKKISEKFMADVKTPIGATSDLFCAPGPDWDQNAGSFDCKPVEFRIDDIDTANQQVKDQYYAQVTLEAENATAQAREKVNKHILAAARAKYGALSEYYLGLLDVIAACKAAGTTCVLNVGGGPTAGVSIPAR